MGMLYELDDIEKEALLGAVVDRARADLNDGKPLTEKRRANMKTEQGFTPGPWKITPSGFFEGVCVRTENNTWVAQVWAAHDGAELPRDANARLIAAAPAMYEALLKCQTYVDLHTHEKRGVCGSLLDVIEAALTLVDAPAEEAQA